MSPVPVSQFGKDHWSLLAYLAAMFYSEKTIGGQQMRCSPDNPRRHIGGWKDEYSTQLRDGSRVSGHDDWDCLWDLEREGFVGVLTGASGIFWLTTLGNNTALSIINHRRTGGKMADFHIDTAPEPVPSTDERFTRVVK